MDKRLAAGIALAVAVAVAMIAVIAFALGARSSDGDARGETAALAEPQPEAGAITGTAVLSDVAFDAGVPAATAALDSAAPEVDAPAGTARADAPAGVEPEIVSSEATQPGSPNEGIQVHGRWTIEVTEPDGRLVSRTEFDNALLPTGAGGLAQILGRVFTVGVWDVVLNGANSASGPCNNNFGPSGCSIQEYASTSSTVSSQPSLFGDLSVDVPTSGPNALSLVLTGSATIANDTDIAKVSTVVHGCLPSSAPDEFLTCVPGSIFRRVMTEKTVAPPVPVLSGQAVNVTVVISFS